jgi:hypothetical protein
VQPGDELMLTDNFHIADQELLQAADGELSFLRAAKVRAHLAACWDCRARMAGIEEAITDFARAYRDPLTPQLPPIAGSRAMLRARLSELIAKPSNPSWHNFFHFHLTLRVFACICATFLIVAVGAELFFQHFAKQGKSALISSDRGIIPDPRLTPGATRQVTINDVCSMPHEDVVREVPTVTRQQIFREYGIGNAGPEDYEIDYLITPGLGGTEDIHNLWPEPYKSRMWNARVKDTLEERLHQMVCIGKIDLATAQHDIATDWIAAYKKYFHTDRPVGLSSQLNRRQEKRSGPAKAT